MSIKLLPASYNHHFLLLYIHIISICSSHCCQHQSSCSISIAQSTKTNLSQQLLHHHVHNKPFHTTVISSSCQVAHHQDHHTFMSSHLHILLHLFKHKCHLSFYYCFVMSSHGSKYVLLQSLQQDLHKVFLACSNTKYFL